MYPLNISIKCKKLNTLKIPLMKTWKSEVSFTCNKVHADQNVDVTILVLSTRASVIFPLIVTFSLCSPIRVLRVAHCYLRCLYIK